MARDKPRRRDRDRGDEGGKRLSLAVPICKDFVRGRCSRPQLDCRYAHPPPTVAIDGEMVTVCFDSLRDRCIRGLGCRYFHPPPHIRVLLQETAGIDPALPSQPNPIRNVLLGAPPRLPPPPLSVFAGPPVTRPSIEVCRDYRRGRCARDAQDCRFAHHTLTGGDGNYVIVCQDFLRGRCERDACRYLHPPEHLRCRIRDLPIGPAPAARERGRYEIDMAFHPYTAVALYEHQAAKRMRIEEHQGDQQRGSPVPFYCGEHGVSLYPGSPPPPPILKPLLQTIHDQDKLPVCRDFLHSKCSRDTACRYVHPEVHTQVVDNHVTLCRDSLRGKCKRDHCRFYHPPSRSASSLQENGDQAANVGSSPLSDTAPIVTSSVTMSPEANVGSA